jgi:hypothetical protein
MYNPVYIYTLCRQHIWFTESSFFGYEDIGGGLGKNPAKHVMMLMVKNLWVGNCQLPTFFSQTAFQARSELNSYVCAFLSLTVLVPQ